MSPPFARLAVLLTLALAGCSAPRAEISPEGTLEVFGASSLAGGGKLPADWVIEDETGSTQAKDRLSMVADGKNAMLTLRSGPQRFIMARRVKATLLASPYIGWAWRMAPAMGGESDIRLIIGFYGGNPDSRTGGTEPFAELGTKLPSFDRAIAISWGHSALERGSLSTDTPIPDYVARGGPENERAWWSDNIDLSNFYRTAWPSDHIERAQITFVGFAVANSLSTSEASFGDVVLYR